MRTAVRLSQRRSLSSPDTSSGATRSTGLASVPSTHTTWSSPDPLDAGEVVEQRAARLHQPHGLRAGVLRARRSGTFRAAASTCSTRPLATVMAPARSSGRPPRSRRSRCGRSASVRRRPASSTPGRQPVVGDDPAGAAGQVDEAPAGELDAAGGRHDVLELVRLVDDRQLVVGEQHAVHGEVEAVEVEVHHDDVGLVGAVAGRLGEAHPAARAPRRAGALLSRHAQRAPRPFGGLHVELGSIAGLGGGGPVDEVAAAPPPALARPRRRGRAAPRPCRRRAPRRGAACRGSSTAPSGAPTRSGGGGAAGGTAGPCRPAGPAGPWWRWPRRWSAPRGWPARGRRASCRCRCPPAPPRACARRSRGARPRPSRAAPRVARRRRAAPRSRAPTHRARDQRSHCSNLPAPGDT